MKQLLFRLPRFYGFHIAVKWNVLQWIFGFFQIYAITLFPFVFYRNIYGRSNVGTRNHESIHVQQQMECGLVGLLVYLISILLSGSWLWCLSVLLLFYLLYLSFFLISLIKLKDSDKAYDEIPFEKEAYNNENISTYLKLRRPFAWLKYVKKL